MHAIKRARLASAQQAGQLPPAPTDLAIDLLWSRWQNGGELSLDYAGALVETVLAGLRAS